MHVRRTRYRLRPRTLLVLPALVALLAGLVAGCGQSLPSTTPGITGTVTSLVPGDERPASFLVEGAEQPAGAVSDKAQVSVAPATTFFDANGKPAEPAVIRTGTKLSVWFEGPVAESYPVQGTAGSVQILAP